MSTTRPHPRVGLAALVAALLLGGTALSGCGISEGRPRPGVAVQVEDERISPDEVDDTVAGLCDFFSAVGNKPFPLVIERQDVVDTELHQAVVAQMMDEQDLAFGSDYDSALATLDNQLSQLPADLPDDLRAAYTDYAVAHTKINNGTYLIGDAAFTASGDVPASSTDVTDRGQQEIAAWISDHDVVIDPQYQLTLVDGIVKADAGGTSVAQSDLAQVGDIDIFGDDADLNDQVAALAALLPADQLCGG